MSTGITRSQFSLFRGEILDELGAQLSELRMKKCFLRCRTCTDGRLSIFNFQSPRTRFRTSKDLFSSPRMKLCVQRIIYSALAHNFINPNHRCSANYLRAEWFLKRSLNLLTASPQRLRSLTPDEFRRWKAEHKFQSCISLRQRPEIATCCLIACALSPAEKSLVDNPQKRTLVHLRLTHPPIALSSLKPCEWKSQTIHARVSLPKQFLNRLEILCFGEQRCQPPIDVGVPEKNLAPLVVLCQRLSWIMQLSQTRRPRSAKSRSQNKGAHG